MSINMGRLQRLDSELFTVLSAEAGEEAQPRNAAYTGRTNT